VNVVIVEGTCGSGKTTLLRTASSMFGEREVRILDQRDTYAPIAAREDDGTLDDDANRRALLDVVERLRHAVASDHLVLVDTLHATQFVRVGALSMASFIEVDRALELLGTMVVMLRVDANAIRARTIEGRRGTNFYEYARKFGTTENDRVTYFVREQQRLAELLANHSRLPVVVLDGDDGLVARFVEAVRSADEGQFRS
jgi:thymidylate kinase